MCVPGPASWLSPLVLWVSLSKVSKHRSVVSCVLVDVLHLANWNCNRQRRLIYHNGKSNTILFDNQISHLLDALPQGFGLRGALQSLDRAPAEIDGGDTPGHMAWA